MRTIVRAEVSAEFYSAPEYWLFGADVSGFAGGDKWSAIMGRIKAWDVDEVGGESAPTLHRFNGASPQPHTDQLRMWQQLFAEDQDLDVRQADGANPSSADAIFAAKESLITVTEDANARWDSGAVQALQTAVMLRDGLTELTPELRGLSIRSTDPRIVSPSARTGAGGRGFSSDCLMLDEAQRLKRSSWVSINSTMSAMPNPQVWLLGTPPTPEDDGDVFESIRSAAMQGGSGATAWAGGGR